MTKKSRVSYYASGHNRLAAALGDFEGDVYDEAVRRLGRVEGAPAAAGPGLTVDDLPVSNGWYSLPNGNKVRGRAAAGR